MMTAMVLRPRLMRRPVAIDGMAAGRATKQGKPTGAEAAQQIYMPV
jgi:hypothetical protein